MKKKIVALLLAGSLAASVIACVGDNGKKVESQKEISSGEDSATSEVEPTEGEDTSATQGEIVEEDGLRKEPVATNKELNLTGTTGPFSYTIEGVQVSKLTATSDETASMLGIEKDKEVTVVAINASAENTSADTLSFYLGQATLTSDTKEQVESDMFLSEYIDGEYIGNVIHSGTLIYILKNTAATDLGKISLHIDAPLDSSFNTIGDEVTLDIAIK